MPPDWEHEGASVRPRIRVGFSSVWTGALGCGGAVDLLGLEALVCMAVAADCNQLADSDAGLYGRARNRARSRWLPPSQTAMGGGKSVIEVGSGAESEIREDGFNASHADFRVDRRQRFRRGLCFIAWSKSYPHSLRISPIMMRSGRWRSAAANNSLGVMANLPWNLLHGLPADGVFCGRLSALPVAQ